MSSDDCSASGRVEIAVAVVEHEGRFLIGRRPEEATLGGYWEFPGGKVEQGESPTAAAVRECWEETGLKVRVIGEYLAIDHDYLHGPLRIYFLACEPVGDLAPLREKYRWVARSELASYRFPPANDGLLSLIARSDAAR